MSERLYRIGPFGGVALPESYDLEPGLAEIDGPAAEVIQLPVRRSLFGFARAFVEAPPLPERTTDEETNAPAEHRFRTSITFRRLWPGERTEVAEAAPVVQPAWRTELVFRRAEAEPQPVVVETAAVPHEEHETSMPSIDPVQAAAEEPENVEEDTEFEVVVEPEIVVPDPEATAVAAVEETPEEPAPKTRKRMPRAPKTRKQGRGGSSKSPRLVGLKVGASQLAAAVVANDGAPEVQQVARTPFESGVVVDGEVRDEDALAAALKDFFAEAKLPTRDVRIGLSSNRIGVRTLEIPSVDDAERFDNAVRFKAHEVLPIAVHESVLDYRVLGERTADGEVLKRVLLVVAPREQVDPYVAAARKAGIRLKGLDLEAFALLRAFVEPHTAGDGHEQAAIVVVSIGHESTTLVVSGSGVCEFTRVFGWGGASLDAAIAAACSVTPVEANAIKTQLSLHGEPAAGLDPAVAGRALEAVRTELTLFARELVSSLQFYQKQPDSLGIGEVVVTGGTTHLDGLAASLNTLVGVPVRIGDPLARVVAGRDVTADPTVADMIGSLAIPIGLGIEDDAIRSVNLLPADAQLTTRKLPSRTQILVPAALAVPVVAVAALFTSAHSGASGKQAELETAQAELATLPEPSSPGIDASIQGEQARRAAVVADVLSKRLSWDRVLNQLGMVLPSDVWLTGVRAAASVPLSVPATPVSSSTSTTPPPPPVLSTTSGVTITGRTFSQVGVARMLARLATVPTFANVQLTRSGRIALGTRTVYEFEIAATMRGAGEAS